MSVVAAPLRMFDLARTPRLYHDSITASVNAKGCMDVDTVKGCTEGMRGEPGGCYGECYAAKIAERYGIDFGTSVSRGFVDQWQHRDIIIRQLRTHPATWYRIGTMGDPSHDWTHTLSVISRLRWAEKTAVIVTKHWRVLTDDHLSRMQDLDIVVHTSTSGMDTEAQTRHRVGQYQRLKHYGIRSLNRIVTCAFGDSEWAREAKRRQDYLLGLGPVIDTPLRLQPNNPRALSGDILTSRVTDAIGGGTLLSLHDERVFLGNCADCPDQCGVEGKPMTVAPLADQAYLFPVDGFETIDGVTPPGGPVEFRYVKSVIGSGFEQQVATLALEDGIAHRAARKNMQIHSAVILLIGGEFAGFMTFQDNRKDGEFCLLQSVIRPDLYTDELYRQMVESVIAQNEAGLPMMMTTNPKSKFETPKMFRSLGFETYLAASGFEYMLNGDPAYHRLKTLAHITMTNVWKSTAGKWLELKREWNERIDEAGEITEIPNPAFATREGCWQGESGFANVVTGRSHNGNASVLDPVACEVILRFFTPIGGRVYNPFGGGVQFGFVAGASGYEYLASEIRQNQCDANNKLTAQFEGVRWVQADSSTYVPEGKFDLVFTCPPYYRVEKYVDYDGTSPEGEINSISTYEGFRDTLFAGYRVAIDALNDNRFIVIMTGDSRGAKGAYHCHEAETELFFKEQGLTVYNKIIYLEAEFTRLAQAKKTLQFRKFPKTEQRIIVAYKGDPEAIRAEFPPIGRL